MRAILAVGSMFASKSASEAESLRLALEELGPIYIKFGQILSTRRDLFNPAVSDELQKLQDQVPPFAGNIARKLVEEALGDSTDNLFRAFDEQPLASASVAQVHGAILHSGESVVVKIIRPDIQHVIRKDIDLMLLIARLMERYSEEARRLHPVQIVKDYEHTIFNELNLKLEAANGNRLGQNWNESGKLYVPRVYWDYTRTNILVLEKIYGINASRVDLLKDADTDLQKLAHLGVEIFFTQVFEQNFFHADMHPGNVFIDVTNPTDPTYIALDCAIMGTLTEEDKNYLACNILAFFHQDYAEVARLHIQSGWVPPDTDAAEFESVIRSVCEPMFQKPIKDISFGQVLVNLFQTARRFNMEVQPQLVLLQKTLINVEGLGRQLYPDLDLWETAAPFMEKWMRKRKDPVKLLKEMRKNLPVWIERLPEIPELAYQALLEMQQMGARHRAQERMLTEIQAELASQGKKSRTLWLGNLALVVAFAGLLFSQTHSLPTKEIMLGSSLIGGLGMYWLLFRP